MKLLPREQAPGARFLHATTSCDRTPAKGRFTVSRIGSLNMSHPDSPDLQNPKGA
jgi:hypothetical protein